MKQFNCRRFCCRACWNSLYSAKRLNQSIPRIMGSLAEHIRRTKTMEIKQAIAFNLSSSEFLVDGYLADLKGCRPFSPSGARCQSHRLATRSLDRHGARHHQRCSGSSPSTCRLDSQGKKHNKQTATIDDPKGILHQRRVASSCMIRVPHRNFQEAHRFEGEKGNRLRQTGSTRNSAISVPNDRRCLALHPNHWLMHAGQWAIVRRKLGRPPLF